MFMQLKKINEAIYYLKEYFTSMPNLGTLIATYKRYKIYISKITTLQSYLVQ